MNGVFQCASLGNSCNFAVLVAVNTFSRPFLEGVATA